MAKNIQTVWARLDEIRIGERRARGVNDATVELYRAWLELGRIAPRVRLLRDGDGFVVRDGRHRVLAAIAAGYAVIEAEVQSRMTTLVGRMVRRLIAARPSRRMRGRCSGGRAPRLQRGSSGFDSHRLHCGAAARVGQECTRGGFLVVG